MSDLDYADEVDLLDSLVEFHPDWPGSLTASERQLLDDYYGVESLPKDLSAWRVRHVEADKTLPSRARAVLYSFPGLDVTHHQ